MDVVKKRSLAMGEKCSFEREGRDTWTGERTWMWKLCLSSMVMFISLI